MAAKGGLLLLFFVSARSYTINDCPSSLPRDHYLQVHGSYCYTFVAHTREYHTAEAECQSRGGNLVVIRDSDTQQFIYNAFRQTYHFTSGVVWIGLTDRQTEGVHVWADGSPLSYTYWAPGEPSGASYDCTIMDLSQRGHWVDNTCEDAGLFTTHRHTFVCENRITAAVSSASTTTVASGVYSTADCPSSLPANSHLYVHGSSCYDFVSSHTKEFNAAERECEQRNGHLVTIKNADTQQFIYNTFTHDLRYHGVVWIGINDQAREGHHVWVDGSPVTYTNWAPSEPTGAEYDCGIMELSQHGQWFDYNCADKFTLFTNENAHHYFVCEYPLTAHQTTTTSPPISTTPLTVHHTSSASPLFTTLSPEEIQNCPSHTPTNGHLYVYGRSCYDFISAHSLEFANAERECATNQGHLVTIHDAGTQSFVYNTFRRDFPNFDGVIWIGMTDQQYEGVHAWTDGSPITYTNWALGQPSAVDPNSDCTIMNINQNGLWYDYNCNDTFPTFHDQEHYFVCEYPILEPPATAITTVSTTITTTSSTTKASTESTTTTPTPTTTTEPMFTEVYECFQCGDIDRQIPCTEAELNETEPTPCPSNKQYCMVDIYKQSRDQPVTYYKRCVNLTNCYLEFYLQYQQSDFCLHLDQDMPDIVACHICCHGDHCNSGSQPAVDTLYQPTTVSISPASEATEGVVVVTGTTEPTVSNSASSDTLVTAA